MNERAPLCLVACGDSQDLAYDVATCLAVPVAASKEVWFACGEAKHVLQTNVRSLQAAFENLSASDSKIRDADFAVETSALTRAQILQASGTTVLGLANQSSQQVLQLLGG